MGQIYLAVDYCIVILQCIFLHMGITKTDLFSKTDNELASLLKALAHPARLAILRQVLEAEVCINAKLVQDLGLAQATVSQHLNVLKEAGLIKGTVEGTSMSYCLNTLEWLNLKSLLNEFLDIPFLDEKRCC
jgi:DNA-binding transcriptional ArsR family regulator